MVATILLCIAASQTQAGKTDAEVLKMGRQAWGDYHAQTEGSSTADMCNAETLFGQVLQRRNDRLLAKSNPGTKRDVAAVRKHLPLYVAGVYEVGTALSGGGTMWNIYHAGALPDTEEVVGHLLGVKSPKAKARRISDVTGELAKLRAEVRTQRKSIELMPSGGGMEAAMAGLKQADREWAALLSVAKRRNRSDSDAILSACIASVADVWEFGGAGS